MLYHLHRGLLYKEKEYSVKSTLFYVKKGCSGGNAETPINRI